MDLEIQEYVYFP